MATIRITIGDRTINAKLADNATAQDLVDQLPLTLTFRDFNHLEKITDLPRRLSMNGVPEGDDPDIGDSYFVRQPREGLRVEPEQRHREPDDRERRAGDRVRRPPRGTTSPVVSKRAHQQTDPQNRNQGRKENPLKP